MTKIDVLDFGYVRLLNADGRDIDVVRAARVSYNAEPREGDEDKDAKLINYLWRNKHTSPFEMVSFKFEVKAPLFVLRQWHRHRTWSYNEVSARYTELDNDFYIPAIDQITTQHNHNKQMRSDEENPLSSNIQRLMHINNQAAFDLYQNLLNMNCPRELARTILPVSTYSRMIAKTDLSNLFKFITLRNHEHAQYEIRVYAEAMLQLIEPFVPNCVEAFKNGVK